MLSFTFEIKGIDSVLQKIHATKDVIADLLPEMTLVGDYLVDFFSNDVWETEGDVLGNRWAELSPKYQAWKAKNFPGRGILEQTGRLRRGFKALPASDFCKIYNDVDYGGYHEFGTSKMPQRVFMKLDQERGRVIRGIVIDSLNKRAKEAVS